MRTGGSEVVQPGFGYGTNKGNLPKKEKKAFTGEDLLTQAMVEKKTQKNLNSA